MNIVAEKAELAMEIFCHEPLIMSAEAHLVR